MQGNHLKLHRIIECEVRVQVSGVGTWEITGTDTCEFPLLFFDNIHLLYCLL